MSVADDTSETEPLSDRRRHEGDSFNCERGP